MGRQQGARGGNYITTATGRRVYVGNAQIQTTRGGGQFYVSASGRRVYLGRSGAAPAPAAAHGLAAPAAVADHATVRAEVPHPEPVQDRQVAAAPRDDGLSDLDRAQRAAHLDQMGMSEWGAMASLLPHGTAGRPLNPSANQEQITAMNRLVSIGVARRFTGPDGSSRVGLTDLGQRLHGNPSAATAPQASRPTPPPGYTPPIHHDVPPTTQPAPHSGESISYGYGSARRTRTFDEHVHIVARAVTAETTEPDLVRRLMARDFRRADAQRIATAALAQRGTVRVQGSGTHGATQLPPRQATHGGRLPPDVHEEPPIPRHELQTKALDAVRKHYADGMQLGSLHMQNVTTHQSTGSVSGVHLIEIRTEFKDPTTGRTVMNDGLPAYMRRRIYFGNGADVVVHHDYFKLPPNMQGNGIGAAMMRQGDALYHRLGADRIEVHANLDVGGYTWAVMGFNFTSQRDKDRIKEAIVNRVESASQGRYLSQQEKDQIRRSLKDAQDCAKFEWRGQRIGKEVMLGEDWSGVRSLKPGDKTYEDGKAYYEEAATRPAQQRRG